MRSTASFTAPTVNYWRPPAKIKRSFYARTPTVSRHTRSNSGPARAIGANGESRAPVDLVTSKPAGIGGLYSTSAVHGESV